MSPEHHGGNFDSDDALYDTRPTPQHDPDRRATLKSRPPIIEITSPKSASGKTTLLCQLTTLSLLPTTYGGNASSVVWLDTDGRFSAIRLSRVIASSLTKHDPQISDRDKELLITSALAHLHVIRPTSSACLFSSLQQLPEYLLGLSNTSRHRRLGLIVLHSATAFQHQDRLEAELIRLSNPSFKPSSQPSRTTEILNALRHLHNNLDCTILFATSQPTSGPGIKKSILPDGIEAEVAATNPWTAFATLTLHLHCLPVAQFAPGMNLDECLRDRERRQAAVVRARAKVSLDLEASEREMWPSGLREKVLGLESNRGFIMILDADGIHVEAG